MMIVLKRLVDGEYTLKEMNAICLSIKKKKKYKALSASSPVKKPGKMWKQYKWKHIGCVHRNEDRA